MVGFLYDGKSSEDIIDVPLCLISNGEIDALGSNRSKVEGESTISRFIKNEYGTIYDPLSFTYGLIKSDFSTFTEAEQRTVERWLTSPKYSSKLTIFNCDENEYYYLGMFLSTNWERAEGGYVMCVFTFQVNGAYAYRHSEEMVWKAYQDIYDSAGTNEGSFIVNCPTDEIYEYVYPLFKITAIDSNYNPSLTLTNTTDENASISVTTARKTTIVLDSLHCRAYLIAPIEGYHIEIGQLRFRDLGWQDIENIRWPRLLPGVNRFSIKGDVDVKIEYDYPFKKVGGWLV